MSEPVVRGMLEEHGLPAVLRPLLREKKTGPLRLTRTGVRGKFERLHHVFAEGMAA